MARIVFKHVTKNFPAPRRSSVIALQDVNLTIGQGEFVVLVGPSGSGKSTMLRLIAGLETPTMGEILFDDRVVNTVPAAERDVAMVFQDPALFPHLTTRENLALGLKLRRVSRAEIEQRVTQTADLLGLTRLLGRHPHELSGGERQRVALGRAVARQPAIFLFDEPLSQLEPALRWELRRQLTTLQERLGTTTLYVTHDQEEAMTLGGRVVVLHQGVVQQEGAPREVYDRPANAFVATLLGSPPINLIRGVIDTRGAGVTFMPQAQTDSPAAVPGAPWIVGEPLRPFAGRPINLGLRPHHLNIASSVEFSDVGSCAGVVEAWQCLGADTYVHLRSHAALLVARADPEIQFTIQQTVQVSWQMKHACVFDAVSGERLR